MTTEADSAGIYFLLAFLCAAVGLVVGGVLLWANLYADAPHDKVSYWPAISLLVLALLLFEAGVQLS